MTAGWPPTPVAVLTPVLPGREVDLVGHLGDMREEPSPFAALESTHVARLVVIGQVRTIAGMKKVKRPLRMRYLLFTAVANSPADVFLEELRSTSGPAVDEVWNHCVRYPGHRDETRFHEYMRQNSVDAQQTFRAYDATVSEVRTALALRRRHLSFARKAQALPSSEIHDAFLKHFGLSAGGD